MKRYIYCLVTIYSILVSGNVNAMTVGQLMELFDMGEEGKTVVSMHMSGIADAMVLTDAWNTVIADKFYKINDFRGVCFPPKQTISGNFLMEAPGNHILKTKIEKGIEAAAHIYQQELVPTLIEIFTAQNCSARKIRD